jgi:hypothetical protein
MLKAIVVQWNFFLLSSDVMNCLTKQHVGSMKRTRSSSYRAVDIFGCFLCCLQKLVLQEPEPESSFGELGEYCGEVGLYAGDVGE